MVSAAARTILCTTLMTLCGGFAVARAVTEKRREKSDRASMTVLLQSVKFIAPTLHDGERVTINGAAVFFRTSTVAGNTTAAVESVLHECAAGDRDRALGIVGSTGEGAARDLLKLEHVRREATEGASAGLCVFQRDNDNDQTDHAPRVRYVLATRIDDKTTSVLSISTIDETSLSDMFPAVSDAPGGDFVGIPRPREARRSLVATIGDHAVRIYETRVSLATALRSYDEDMAAAGLVGSSAVANSLDDVRAYRNGTTEIVASFQVVSGSAVITIAPMPSPSSNPVTRAAVLE